MVVLPVGFTPRVGEEKKPSVVTREFCVVTRVCCPVPTSLGCPGTGTVEVQLVPFVCREKLLAPPTPGRGPGSLLTWQHGAVPVLCVHTRNHVAINSL